MNSALTAVANTAQNALSTVIGWLDRLSFKLNKALNKDGYSTFDTYEGWKASQYKSTVTDADRQRRQQLHDSRVQQAQTEKELADLTGGGVIVSDIPSSSGSSGTKKTSKKATETVLRSTTDNYTKYSQNALGQVETTVEAVNEHIRDSTGKEFDRLTEKVTESGKEMVNGVEREYTLVTTKVDGVTQKVTKSYADMSKVLTDTAKKNEHQLQGRGHRHNRRGDQDLCRRVPPCGADRHRGRGAHRCQRPRDLREDHHLCGRRAGQGGGIRPADRHLSHCHPEAH